MKFNDRIPVGYVQKAEKKVPYSISVIGGLEDLKQWREERNALEAKLKEIAREEYKARRNRITLMLTGEINAPGLTDIEIAEINYKVSRRKKKDLHSRNQYVKPGVVPQEIQPKLTLFQKLKASIKRLFL